MVVCQYFLRGQCRFGESCRNEHPQKFTNNTWTNAANAKPILPFTQESIKNDLSIDKPMWPLATYGPAKHEPNLIAALDESMEELRVRATAALKAGNLNEYTAYQAAKITAAEQTFNNARTNLSQLFQTAAAQSPHAPKPTSTSAFGTPATSATNTNTTPTTATTATTTTSAFGAPSAFGKPAFGSQSAFGQSAFAAPASAATTSSPSAFGQPAPLSAFSGNTGGGGGGTAAAAATTLPSTTAPATSGSVFGQSSFGQPTSAFGQSPLVKPASGAFSAFANTGPSPFAAAAAAANPGSAPGGSGGGFSAFATQQPTTSPFGSGGNVFGQNTNTNARPPLSAFGQPQNATPSAFGNNSPFGSNNNNNNAPFGTTPTSAFGVSSGAQSAFGTTTSNQSVFNTQSSNNTNPTPSAFNPLTGSVQSFPPPPPSSVFTPLSGSFNPPPLPAAASTPGPPDFSLSSSSTQGKKKYFKPGTTPYDQLLPFGYIEMIPQDALEAFKGDKFEWGKVPDWIPPVELR